MKNLAIIILISLLPLLGCNKDDSIDITSSDDYRWNCDPGNTNANGYCACEKWNETEQEWQMQGVNAICEEPLGPNPGE